MKIKQVVLSKSTSGFYFDDQKAIKSGKVTHDGFFYEGQPQTGGFNTIRLKGEAISIQLVLEDGTVGYGDCAAVQYSGAGGRDPLFLADENMKFIKDKIVPLLIGVNVSRFKENAEKFDKLTIDGQRVHTAIRYGVTQALLSATANYHKLTMAEIIRKEYQIKDKKYKTVPIFSQSGDEDIVLLIK